MKIVDIPTQDRPLVTLTEMKQWLDYMKIQAEVNWNYFNNLKAQGFSDQQAIELVKSFKFGG